MIELAEKKLLQYIAVATDQSKRTGRNRVVYSGEGVAHDDFN
jgi:hypothetical protein